MVGLALKVCEGQPQLSPNKPVNASGGSRVFCLPRRWPPPALPWTFAEVLICGRVRKMKSHASTPVSRFHLSRSIWLSLLMRGSVILLVLGVVVAVGLQFATTNELRSAARRIHLGDDRATVHSLLGIPHLGYGPPMRSAVTFPIVTGEMYGGPLNSMHHRLDSFVRRSFRPDASSLYIRRFSQHFREWPVLVEYTPDGHVTGMYEDGVQLLCGNPQRTHKALTSRVRTNGVE